MDAKEALNNIINIIKIHHISMLPSESMPGFIIFILVIILIIILIISIALLFTKKYKYLSGIFTKDLWILMFTGFFINIIGMSGEYGKLTVVKCHMKSIGLSYGFILTFIPILYVLINNFPNRKNKTLNWIKKNKYSFIFLFLLYDVILNGLLFIKSFTIKDHIIDDNQNYQTCKIKNIFSKLIAFLILLEKIIILIVISLLIFMEWNIVKTKRDIRLITGDMYISIFIIMAYIVSYLITFKSYSTHFLMRSGFMILFILSNYWFLYGIKLYSKKKDIEYEMSVKKVRASASVNNKPSSNMDEVSVKRNSIFSTLLYYHNCTGNINESGNSILTPHNQSISIQKSNNNVPLS